MKKIYLLFIIAALLFNEIKAQSFPPPPPQSEIDAMPPASFGNDIIDPPPATPSANCSRSSSNFAFYNDVINHIPNPNTPVKKIEIAFNVFQKFNFTGNFHPDSANHKQALLNMLEWINKLCYRLNLANQTRIPSDPVPGVTEIDDSRIEFSLGTPGNERIELLRNSV